MTMRWEMASNPDVLESLAKLIQDLQQLITLLLRGLTRARPWQRQLAGHLADVDQQLHVLRLTVAMERRDAEILEAAEHLACVCRLSAAALAGSRVDPTTRTAVHLIVDLAERIHSALGQLER